jgi:diguanylate cyclase (GGDEF)-like protein
MRHNGYGAVSSCRYINEVIMVSDSRAKISGKTALIFRLIVLFSLSCGLAEMVELFLPPYFSFSALVFELLEHVVLVIFLLIFMTKYVTNPLFKEMALRQQSEQLLELSELKHRSIIAALPDAVLQVAADGTVIDYLPKQISPVSFQAGRNVCDSLPAEMVVNFLNCLNTTLQDGGKQQTDLMFSLDEKICYLVFNFVRSGEQEVTVFIRDITTRKTHEEQLEYLSTHDVLTGLYNRTFYEAELECLATGTRYPVSIIVVDLDGLKTINDTYGHIAGDNMICKAARVLKDAFRDGDLVARTGGDEFSVLLPETGAGVLQAAVERLEAVLAEANRVEDGLPVKFSFGFALAENREKLLGAVKVADMKMYQNKTARRLIQDNDAAGVFANSEAAQ